MLSKEEILGSNDLIREVVNVPEWGGDVYVYTMTGEERDSFEVSIVDGKGKTTFLNIRAKLCARTIRDEEGNRIFTDKEIDLLGKKSGIALDRIFDVAKRLNGIGKEEIKELENLAEEKNVKIDLKAEDGLKLTADRLLFGRVVSNLLKNAIEASPEGGLVSVKAYVRKKKVILEVEDSGSGIEETQAEKIFEPFISSKSSGFGIGLYLTRKIVAAHGGKISFSNRPGGGAVFKVEMPGGESG